ncbi:MAG: aldo/keto reductase [Tabrizicola sp.]|uniref:aldo/keto reductase n=1 Tax=Tabrizicola sp. TaxID=2005166 RepID=UPI00273663B7|nr:aldo/keto reductase [Tabrizicola sp.]MDP3261841.1 aldo/keto reductase [Tabrizicola sp.]MDP3649551.1 aldo/keto reductase [Paracoccaceae bacterium]MDZ4069507.1 aldo/keto reductase [Tabrizicola sp.]
MQQRQLGANGPMVSAIGLGCLSFGGLFGATTDDVSLRCLDAAWDHGITFLDTANIYGAGRSETVVGEWLRRRKHRPVLATKASIVPGPTRRIDNSAPYLRAELEGSLKRLGTDHIDLFYIHRHEAARPIEEVADTLATLVREGKIGGYGMSEVAPYTLERAHAVHPVRAIQNEYSLWTRQPELGLIQRCASLGTAFVPFSPLARGAFGQTMLDPATLTPGEFRTQIPRFSAENWPRNKTRIEAFRAYADDRGHSPAALALAWVLAQGLHLIPIPGTRTAAHLAHWAGASDITLTPEDHSEIARLLPVGWAFGDRYDDDQTTTVERYC